MPEDRKDGNVPRTSHSTEQELHFLEHMGRNRDRVLRMNERQSRAHRLACLRGYREAASKRDDWGLIDKKVVLAFVDKLMEELK